LLAFFTCKSYSRNILFGRPIKGAQGHKCLAYAPEKFVFSGLYTVNTPFPTAFLLKADKYQLENTWINKYTDKRRSGGLSVFVGICFIEFPTFAVTVVPTPHGRCGPLSWPFQEIVP